MNGNKNAERYADIINRLYTYAEQDSAMTAVIAIGSSVRTEVRADEYSDIDIIIVTREPESWYSGEYPEKLGKVDISFIEPTLGDGMERRCIYDGEKDADFLIFTPEQFTKALEEGTAEWVMNRGYKVLYDSENFAEMAEKYVHTGVKRVEMTEREFVNTVNDFYFHNIWAMKKLRRGELWSAKMCIDSYLKSRLLKMIEEYQIIKTGADVWHDGRFLDRWAGPDILEKLRTCFAGYDAEECRKALLSTHRLFAELSENIAENRGFGYPYKAQECAAKYLAG